jgi:single-strand DNA-binding protein
MNLTEHSSCGRATTLRLGWELGGKEWIEEPVEVAPRPSKRSWLDRTSIRSAMTTTITLIGNLTKEPEIRYTRDGQATTTLGVAVNRRWQDRSTREWEESTSFFDVVCWRELAENAALSLVKGMRVVVTGRLEHRSWDTEDGEHRSKVEVVADDLGPSLRYATAEVQRNERRGAAPDAPADDPPGSEAPMASVSRLRP